MDIITSITLDRPVVLSVPASNWREKVVEGEPIHYTLLVTGKGEVVWEDNSAHTLDIELKISVKDKRMHSINGLLDKKGWRYQPGIFDSSAKALMTTEESVKGVSCEAFELDADGRVQFDEPGLSWEQAEKGLQLFGFHTEGKSLRLTNVIWRAKKIVRRNGASVEIVEVRSADGTTIDTPRVTIKDDENDKEGKVSGVVRAAMRAHKK